MHCVRRRTFLVFDEDIPWGSVDAATATITLSTGDTALVGTTQTATLTMTTGYAGQISVQQTFTVSFVNTTAIDRPNYFQDRRR